MKLGFTVYQGIGPTTIDFFGTVLTLIALVFLVLSVRREMLLLPGLLLTVACAAAGFALKRLAMRVNERREAAAEAEAGESAED